MAKIGKRLKKAYEGLDPEAPPVRVEEAVKQVKSRASAKFDETVEIAMNLNLDPRKPDQNLRGTVMLPHGTGKSVRVAVFARGDRAKEAEAAGADIVGAEDLAEKVQAGQIDFDRAIATPDMMAVVGRLGKILGPRHRGHVDLVIETGFDDLERGRHVENLLAVLNSYDTAVRETVAVQAAIHLVHDRCIEISAAQEIGVQ